jgi:carbonic anhydrase/acetyltransferase-like protein (isoleucine patch superfamily)
MSTLLRLAIVLAPWPLKRWLLQHLYGYQLHRSSRIGFAWVFPRRLVMERNARIGHLTVCKGLELLQLGECASIGRLNWVSAYPLGQPPHFMHIEGRKPELLVGEHAAITHRHIIDCTEQVVIGRFTTLAGFRTQVLTHSIDLRECRQHAAPVNIGCCVFIGTACTILGGTIVPDYCVVGANALLNDRYEGSHQLLAGVPAKPVAKLDPALKYFTRTEGFIT